MTKPAHLAAGRFVLGIGSALCLAAGCLSAPKKAYPEKRYFVLNAQRDGVPRAALPGLVLQVRPFRISPRYQVNGFMYQTSASRLETDFYNEFLRSPAELITEQMRRWLKGSGLFAHVVPPGSAMDATHVLEGAVDALFDDYRQKKAPQAVLELQMFVLREADTGTRVVFDKTYRETLALEKPGAEARLLVRGWNEALRKIFTQFEADLLAAGLGGTK